MATDFNPNAMHYGHILRVNKQILAQEQTLTATAVKGNGDIVMADRTQGSMSVVIQASSPFTIAANGVVAVTLKQGPTRNPAPTEEVSVSFKKTHTKETKYAAGQVIGVLPIAEDCGPFIDAFVSGATTAVVDLVLAYVPR